MVRRGLAPQKDYERLRSLSRVNRIEWQSAFRNGCNDRRDKHDELYQKRNVIPTWLD